jgi:putative oxidoreductase
MAICLLDNFIRRRLLRAKKGMSAMNFTIIPRSWTPSLHAVLRIVTGLLLLDHGTGKILGFPDLSAIKPMLGALFYVTGGIELVGGLLILVGFLTRPAAFILSGFTAAAYFMAHFPQGFFPALNGGDAAILFCFICLYLAAAGAGPWAIDKE